MNKKFHQQSHWRSRNRQGGGGTVGQKTTIYHFPGVQDRQNADSECFRCANVLEPDSRFCTICGAKQSVGQVNPQVWINGRPSIFRRLLAEAIDRVLRIFLVFFLSIFLLLAGLIYSFWVGIGILFFSHLLRDCMPKGRSFGKRFFGLRVIDVRGRSRIPVWRAMVRRFPTAITQVAYGIGLASVFARAIEWEAMIDIIKMPWPEFAGSAPVVPGLIISALLYDLFSVAVVLISETGRRVEDRFLGAIVVLDSVFVGRHNRCIECGQLIPKTALFCPLCGVRNAPDFRQHAAD